MSTTTASQTNASQTPIAPKNRIAIVTGASSGLGQAIARELRDHGFRVYALARSLPDYFLDPACEENTEKGCLRPIKIDVTDHEAMQAAIGKILATECRVDCLVQAAGYGLAGAVEDTDSDEARAQFETNFFGTIHALPLVLRQMRQQRHGLIVQLGSVAGFLPIPYQAYYSAGKAALTALTLALADEVRPWGIKCLIIQAGDTKTGFTRSRIMASKSAGSDYAERLKRSVDRMAADEANGVSARHVAKLIVRRINRRRPPLVFTPGFLYKAAAVLVRVLPARMTRLIIRMMYAS